MPVWRRSSLARKLQLKMRGCPYPQGLCRQQLLQPQRLRSWTMAMTMKRRTYDAAAVQRLVQPLSKHGWERDRSTVVKCQPACVFVATATVLFCGFHPPPRPLLLLFVLLLILLALFFATRIAQSLSHIFTLFYWDWSVALLAHAYLRPFLELLVLKLVLKLVLVHRARARP